MSVHVFQGNGRQELAGGQDESGPLMADQTKKMPSCIESFVCNLPRSRESALEPKQAKEAPLARFDEESLWDDFRHLRER